MNQSHLTSRAVQLGPEHTLSIDIGGSGLKASVLDGTGKMLVDRVRIPTPYPCPPKVMVHVLLDLVRRLPDYDRVSVGFPGAVRVGRVLTAPHFGDRVWRSYPLAATLAQKLGKPVRLLNDAEVQGFGLISARGLEFVLTLGTGAGTALFRDGELMPHLELSQHSVHLDHSYDDYIGNDALRRLGVKKWSHHVRKAIKSLQALLHYDTLYIGGGNSDEVIDPPPNAEICSNLAGVTGGVHLWNPNIEPSLFDGDCARRPLTAPLVSRKGLHRIRSELDHVP